MYAGRPGYGGKLPYAGLGERIALPYGRGGNYLGDFFDDVSGFTAKISAVAGKISEVATGKATVTTVPTGYSSFTLPVAGGYSQAIPLWVLGAGAGALLLLAMRKRR